jgi:hypothetical protein
MKITQVGRTNDGPLYVMQGDIIKVETEKHSFIGEFLCFDRTFWAGRPSIILKITDCEDADITNMKIRCFEIQRITKYQEVGNDRRGPASKS